jgi:hypothetical protein
MILLHLVLGIALIFASGALANSYGSTKDRRDFYISLIGFTSGIYVLISMIGLI